MPIKRSSTARSLSSKIKAAERRALALREGRRHCKWRSTWRRGVGEAAFPPRGGRCRCGATTDEGGRAERDGLVKLRSFRHCITYPRCRQLGRGYHKLVLQLKNPKALFSRPGVTVLVGEALRAGFMAWTVLVCMWFDAPSVGRASSATERRQCRQDQHGTQQNPNAKPRRRRPRQQRAGKEPDPDARQDQRSAQMGVPRSLRVREGGAAERQREMRPNPAQRSRDESQAHGLPADAGQRGVQDSHRETGGRDVKATRYGSELREANDCRQRGRGHAENQLSRPATQPTGFRQTSRPQRRGSPARTAPRR